MCRILVHSWCDFCNFRFTLGGSGDPGGRRVSGYWTPRADPAAIQIGETRFKFALVAGPAALEPVLTPPRATPQSNGRSVNPASSHASGGIPPERRATAAVPATSVQRQTPDQFGGTKPAQP